MLNEDIIIEAIHELSTDSAAGPDCVPSSLLVNCATDDIVPVLLLIFSHSLSHGVIPNLGRELLLFRFTSLTIKLSHVIIVLFT